MNLVYRAPGSGEKEQLLDAVTSGTPYELREAMVAAVFNVDDWKWLQDQFLALLKHPDADVRSVAATCLGHVATFYGHLDVSTVRPALEALLEDPRNRGYAETALEDINGLGADPS